MRFEERLAAMLAAGTSEHYEDALLYEHEYKRRRDDIRYYRQLARAELGAPAGDRPILELGAGAGRILVPLARDGWPLVGVDASPSMLQRCRERLERWPRALASVELRRADFRQLALERRFPLVLCPFNAFMHLYTRADVERFCAVVHRHLRPGGLFAFDVLNPDVGWLARDPNKRWSRTRFRHPRTGRRMIYSTSHTYDAALQIAFMRIFYEPEAGGRTRVVQLAHRQFFPLELAALLHYNGFVIEEIAGDFDGGPLLPESEVQVLRCRSRRGFSVSRRKNI